jgi:hypothetical protein
LIDIGLVSKVQLIQTKLGKQSCQSICLDVCFHSLGERLRAKGLGHMIGVFYPLTKLLICVFKVFVLLYSSIRVLVAAKHGGTHLYCQLLSRQRLRIEVQDQLRQKKKK